MLDVVISLVIGLGWLVIGYVVAVILETVLKRAFTRSGMDEKLTARGMGGALIGLTLSGFITGIVKWTVFLMFLAASVNVIEKALLAVSGGIAQPILAPFLSNLAGYIVPFFQGIVILIAGFLLADYLANGIRTGMKTQANVLAAAVKIIVIYFTVTIALSHEAFNIDITIITDVFQYLVMAVALGVGGGTAIALGLGLKDSVSRIAKKHEASTERALMGKIKR
ncbi:MAG: hypothetical protein KAW41_06675 [Candidatus Diapherotrites archaeon]|nr:hypothetical protein [Candidatus Diapherotrites archaeon]